jgi:hypothetical protein
MAALTVAPCYARGFIARDSATRRYLLTDTGRAVLGLLLEHGGIKPDG